MDKNLWEDGLTDDEVAVLATALWTMERRFGKRRDRAEEMVIVNKLADEVEEELDRRSAWWKSITG